MRLIWDNTCFPFIVPWVQISTRRLSVLIEVSSALPDSCLQSFHTSLHELWHEADSGIFLRFLYFLFLPVPAVHSPCYRLISAPHMPLLSRSLLQLPNRPMAILTLHKMKCTNKRCWGSQIYRHTDL
jgi:hypothetical protein